MNERKKEKKKKGRNKTKSLNLLKPAAFLRLVIFFQLTSDLVIQEVNSDEKENTVHEDILRVMPSLDKKIIYVRSIIILFEVTKLFHTMNSQDWFMKVFCLCYGFLTA